MESIHPRRGLALSFSKGFSLIELLVVLAIIGVIMAIVLVSQTSFNNTFILQNTAYDVALTLRDAETYGLGSRASGATTNAGYGVHFQIGNSFKLFADTNPSLPASGPVLTCHVAPDASMPSAQPGDCAYQAGLDANTTTYTLGNGITITNFCVYRTFLDWTCAGGTLTSFDVVFARPNPTPFMSMNGSYPAAFPITAACVTLSSVQGNSSRFIKISQSGMIQANATSCP